jgi:3-hydroxyisobutyrate dehydrogenase-like beta-hydroxyacid dehydrogenase
VKEPSKLPHRITKNVGVIGLGIIGERVAGNLRKRGFQVYVWNRTPRPVQNFLGSPAEVAQMCDFVQIFVSDDEALLEMARQLSSALKAQHIVSAHSTVAPETMRATADIVRRRGALFLDAPFTGSKAAAEKGELVYYIGGDDATLRQARPVLEASSKEIVEIGEIGEATLMKVATNIITVATVQAGAEALALIRKSGLSSEKLIAAMRANASGSATLSTKLTAMAAGNFAPNFSLKHMFKDMRIARRIANSLGIDLPLTELARDLLMDELKNGRENDDYSSIAYKYFPDAASYERPAALETARENTSSDSQTSLPADENEAASGPKSEAQAQFQESEVAEKSSNRFGRWFRARS